MNYPVYFENSKGERRIIGEAFDLKAAFDLISTFLVDHDYKSYYTRLSALPNEWEIDVGSHSEFFYVSRDVVDNLDQP